MVLKIIKKADIYFTGHEKEMRISMSFYKGETVSQIMDAIAHEVEIYADEEVKIQSIYFSEETIK